MLGLDPYKPILTALAMPPVPLLLLVLLGARLILPRRGLGWLILLTAVTLLWLSCCQGVGAWLNGFVLHPPSALNAGTIDKLKHEAQAHPNQTAILVLGGGRVELAPEYGVSDLAPPSAERLRYAMWLAKQTNLPVGFSGGIGWADQGTAVGQSEAEIAASVAQRIYGRSLRWTETESRDTQANAYLSVKLLQQAGVHEIVLVTNAWHMPRALRHFEAAAAAAGGMHVTPAPMGFTAVRPDSPLAWLPSTEGYVQVRQALRELLGLAMHA
ncbi:MAG: YdcF family protein [Aquabacterium sp.]|jgi:uncharacterized SAM-binding protein YcdF (DUF218 family)|nr:MAG: YdcF family protein [Aquabacterium sp.]